MVPIAQCVRAVTFILVIAVGASCTDLSRISQTAPTQQATPSARPDAAATSPPPDERVPTSATQQITLYWLAGETLVPETRTIPRTARVGTAALEELLKGPADPTLSTALPTPQEVQRYAGREADWGDQVRLLGLTIEDGIATANFSKEMQAFGGGSARVMLIRAQITRTLQQFPTVSEAQIAIEGETEDVLQP